MNNSKLVKTRRNNLNYDVSIGIPAVYKKLFDQDYFECSLEDGNLVYRPLNISGSAEVVETMAPPQQTNPIRKVANV